MRCGPTTASKWAYLREAQNLGTLDIAAIHVIDIDANRIASSTSFDSRDQSLEETEQPWTRKVEAVQQYSSVSSVVAISDRAYVRDNETVFAFASPVPDRDRVVVAVSLPTSEAYAIGRSVGTNVLAIVLGCMLTLGVGSDENGV